MEKLTVHEVNVRYPGAVDALRENDPRLEDITGFWVEDAVLYVGMNEGGFSNITLAWNVTECCWE